MLEDPVACISATGGAASLEDPPELACCCGCCDISSNAQFICAVAFDNERARFSKASFSVWHDAGPGVDNANPGIIRGALPFIKSFVDGAKIGKQVVTNEGITEFAMHDSQGALS
jgi:hypothetical protein